MFSGAFRAFVLRVYLHHYQTQVQELQGDSEKSTLSPAEGQSQSGKSADSYESYQQECTLLSDCNIDVALEVGSQYPAFVGPAT